MVRYIVQHGDTLGTIAVKYGTSVRVIARANGIRNPNWIQVGQILKIPTNMYDDNNNYNPHYGGHYYHHNNNNDNHYYHHNNNNDNHHYHHNNNNDNYHHYDNDNYHNNQND